MKHIRMKREDAKKWLAALRSGEYKQGKQTLRTSDNKFCCLGVLQHCLTGSVETYSGPNSDEALSLPTPTWLEKHDIEFTKKDGIVCQWPWLSKLKMGAVSANDGTDPLSPKHVENKTFEEIADAIEEEIEYID